MLLLKRFIAAALSLLVGAFGYTIVDNALENRVSSLESEVVELKEEMSEYHGVQLIQPPTTSVQSAEFTTAIYPEQGLFLDKTPDSQSKFLFRKYSNGNIQYFSANSLNNATSMTDNSQYEEYLLYVTDSSAQIIRVDEQISNKDWYDEEYSIYPTTIVDKTVTVSIVIEGYTDPVFAGKRIKFSHYSYPYFSSINYINNTIQPDGSFSYQVEYVIQYTERESMEGISKHYSFYYPTIYS